MTATLRNASLSMKLVVGQDAGTATQAKSYAQLLEKVQQYAAGTGTGQANGAAVIEQTIAAGAAGAEIDLTALTDPDGACITLVGGIKAIYIRNSGTVEAELSSGVGTQWVGLLKVAADVLRIHPGMDLLINCDG